MARKTIIPEEELLSLLNERSEKGFNILYDNYSAAIYGVILRMVEDKELAEDLAQESFVRIWNNFHQYDKSKGRLFTWMINLARNLCIDKIRSKDYSNTQKNQSLDNSVSVFDRQQSTENKPELIGVKSMVEKLSPELRQVIELMYFGGYTQTEIAEEFNIPLGTVKTRARTAMNQLRQLFGAGESANP